MLTIFRKTSLAITLLLIIATCLPGNVSAATGNSVNYVQGINIETTENSPAESSERVASQESIFFDNLTRYSPNGNYRVRVSALNYDMTEATIWIENADGLNSQSLITCIGECWVTNPIWSPNSEQIAYLKVLKAEVTQYFVGDQYEIWIINRDGSNNYLLTNTSLFNPVLGYGGQTDISWTPGNEITFFDHAPFPAKKYAINTDTLAIREIPSNSQGFQASVLPNSYSLNVEKYKQTDSAWQGDRLNGSSGCPTIGAEGCALTSTAMVLNYFGYKISGAKITPGNLNTWLSNNQGYSGCQIYWYKVQGINSSISYDGSNLYNPNLAKLQNEISTGNPVILWYYTAYGNMHFVVATGYNGSTITINDPLNSVTSINFSQIDGGMVIYHGQSTPPPTSSFSKTSPANSTTIDLPTTPIQLLTWTSAGIALPDKYEYCIDESPGNQCDGSWNPRSPSSTYVYSNDESLSFLQPGRTYYWQVRTKDSGMVANDGQWWSFTIGSSLPSTFSKIAPANGSIAPLPATLSWEALANAAAYKYCIDTDPSCEPSTDVGNVTHVTLPNELRDSPSYTPYYWQVSAVNSSGETISASDGMWSFTPIVTISGNVQVGGATIAYTGGSVLADSNGNYVIAAPPGWSGKVVPSASGYTFSPPEKWYTNITASLTENYSAKVTISGNVQVAGTTLSYTDGAPKTVTADENGNYTITVPYSWSGTVTPFKDGYTFLPSARSYGNITASLTENYNAQVTISGNIGIAGATLSYTGSIEPLLTSSDGSYEFTVPYNWIGTVTPTHTCYTFEPANRPYTNVTTSQTTQNYNPTFTADFGCVKVDATIGSNPTATYSIPNGETIAPFYDGIVGGPVQVISTNGGNILASEHRNYQTSFAETVGFPDNRLTTKYWFTKYAYNANVKTWLLVANPSNQAANVSIYIGNLTTPIESFQLAAGASVSKFYDGVANGPVQVVSTNGVNIFASEHRNYQTSFAETVGFPDNQLTTKYWFTKYAYNANVKTWLLVANPSNQAAEVSVYIGTSTTPIESFQLAAGASVSKFYDGIADGPMRVVSTNGVNIFASEHRNYQTSFAETVGFPDNQLTTKYWFTHYAYNANVKTWLLVANPQ